MPLHFGNIQELLSHYLHKEYFSQIFVLVDENTKKDCLPFLPSLYVQVIEIKSGEKHKNLETCTLIWESLLQHKADRTSLLINLGGGVICDMGGFAASCYKRGIRFINIPTSLLAMVDASLGGKTGIDFFSQKNMLGLFKEAEEVFIDIHFLKTLDPRHLKSAKAEMLKHGLIANEEHFWQLTQSDEISLSLIQTSLSIKQNIVAADPLEKGLRKALNFGHTLGHALESWRLENGQELLHGEAVAQGMLWAIELSVSYCNLDPQLALKYQAAIEAIFGRQEISLVEFEELLELASNDKKNQDAKINFSLLAKAEQVVLDCLLTKQEIKACLYKQAT
ncbi:MAG: 3-dehydroquinate synthase [Chitinophagales bacterium]|nr:3-dehydroquinate synthase [Chitinophagales bacterium]